MYKLVMIIMVTSSTYGAVFAEDARPSQEATSMEGLLEKAVILRDDAHEKARNSIIARLGHASDREELLRIVADPNKDGNMRRLARVCLLRKDHPEMVDDFRRSLTQVVVEHWRLSHSGPMPRSGYKVRLWDNLEGLSHDLKGEDVPKTLLPLLTALKKKELYVSDLLAEVLVWRSPESVGKQIISETASSYGFPGSLFSPDDPKAIPAPWRKGRDGAPAHSKEHDVGLVATGYAGQLLVLATSSKAEACEALSEWCRRESESSQFALRDIESATTMAGMNAEVQSRCAKALVDCVMPESPEGTKYSAVGWLKALASDSKRVSLAARVECVKGIGRIGGQDAERTLSDLSKQQDEAVAKAAKDAIKKLTEKSPGASSSVGPEGRP